MWWRRYHSDNCISIATSCGPSWGKEASRELRLPEAVGPDPVWKLDLKRRGTQSYRGGRLPTVSTHPPTHTRHHHYHRYRHTAWFSRDPTTIFTHPHTPRGSIWTQRCVRWTGRAHRRRV